MKKIRVYFYRIWMAILGKKLICSYYDVKKSEELGSGTEFMG